MSSGSVDLGQNFGSGGSGVDTIGALDGQSPSPDGLVISGSTLYAQSASASDPGMVNNSAQSFSGAKSFIDHMALGNNGSIDSDIVVNLDEQLTVITANGNNTGMKIHMLATPAANSPLGEITSLVLASNTSGAHSVGYVGGLSVSSTKGDDGDGTSVWGVIASADLEGVGTLDSLIGGEFGVFNGGSGTVTDAFGAKIDLTFNSGTITNLYGLYIDDQSGAGATNAWALYSVGGNSFHQGHFLLGGAVDANNALLIAKDGHIKSTQTTPPAAAPSANAGTGATCTLSNATDAAGRINLTTTSSSPSSGAQATITFNMAYNVAPIVVVTPGNAAAAQLAVSSGVYFTSTTTTLVVNFAVADAIGHAYVWNYECIETQN